LVHFFQVVIGKFEQFLREDFAVFLSEIINFFEVFEVIIVLILISSNIEIREVVITHFLILIIHKREKLVIAVEDQRIEARVALVVVVRAGDGNEELINNADICKLNAQ
jgi:hypothetical protein